MSAVVEIELNKKIGLKFLDRFCQSQDLYYGVPDFMYVIDQYKGDEDIVNELFVLYDRSKYGRGMSFIIDENNHVELMLNYPATSTDIHLFFKFIHHFLVNFNLDSFIYEGELYNLSQIPSLKEETLSFNESMVKSFLKSGLTIFGCIYPLTIEQTFIEKINNMNNSDAYHYYANYLDEKQKMDCYYAKPLIYETNQKNHYIARYALTENVPTIFPLHNELPFGYNQDLKNKIKSWSVFLVGDMNGKLEPIKEIEYHEFCQQIDLSRYKKFDETHVIITFTKDWLSLFNKDQILEAKESLINWLSHSHELGKKPVKIEYCMSFVDEDEIECMIFKYKKTLLSKWLLGIVSDSGVFSCFKEYRKDQQIKDAKEILEMLKEYWKNEAKKYEG